MAAFDSGIWVSQSRRKWLQELAGCEAETIFKLYPLGQDEKGKPAPATQEPVAVLVEESSFLCRKLLGSSRVTKFVLQTGEISKDANGKPQGSVTTAVFDRPYRVGCCNGALHPERIDVTGADGSQLGSVVDTFDLLKKKYCPLRSSVHERGHG